MKSVTAKYRHVIGLRGARSEKFSGGGPQPWGAPQPLGPQMQVWCLTNTLIKCIASALPSLTRVLESTYQ